MSRFHARSLYSYQYHFHAVRRKRHTTVFYAITRKVSSFNYFHAVRMNNVQDYFCVSTRKVSFKPVFTPSWWKYHTAKAPTTAAAPYIMADSVGHNRPHVIITMGGPNNLVVGKLADSVGGNRPRLIITTRRP